MSNPDFPDWAAIVLRWVHLLAAITAVGGTVFMRFALVPSVSILADEQRKALHEQVRSRWVKFVMGAILFLLVSGFYNFFRRLDTLPADYKGLYHALFGVKFLLALVIFFIASALTGRAAALAPIRRNTKLWLTANVVLAVMVICISGVLRFVPSAAPPPAKAQTSQEAQPRSVARHG